MVLMVTLMVGAVIGLVVAMIAVWRSGALPRAAIALLVAFQVFDLVEVPFRHWWRRSPASPGWRSQSCDLDRPLTRRPQSRRFEPGSGSDVTATG